MKKYLLIGYLAACLMGVRAQGGRAVTPTDAETQGGGTTAGPVVSTALMHGNWSANWISCPGVSQRAYGVYHFRKTFVLSVAPVRFIVHVSADNRYRLFVNGRPVCFGPARSDLAHWNFETIDIAAY